MKFNLWTPQEEAELAYWLELPNSTTEGLSQVFTEYHLEGIPGFEIPRSLSAIKRKIHRLQNTGQLALPQEETSLPPEATKEEVHPVDQHWESIELLQAMYSERSKFNTVGLAVGPPTTKILSLSDIHFPFARTDFLQRAIHDHQDADILVLNGDILDGYIFSSFEKEKSVAAIDEYNTAFEFVSLCSKIFNKVVLTSGNHESRYEKTLTRSLVPREGQSIFQTDPLARIANGERLGRDGSLLEKVPMPNVYYPQSEKWWVQIGKTLFIHPFSRGSSKPGFTVSAWAGKFKERLPPGSFDSIVCGHTHAQNKHLQGNLLLIEQGCLCDYMSYSWSPRQVFHSSAINGYAVIYQDADGNTDFNLSNFVYLGQLLPVDKPLFSGG